MARPNRPEACFTAWIGWGLLSILAMLVMGCTSGSSTNPHDDWVMVPESTERSMGRSGARQLEDQVGVYESEELDRYLDNVGSRIAVYSDRSDLEYKFKILDVFVINALALPGGYIYVTRGLLQKIENEAQLAGILAHEVAHVSAFHAVKRAQLSVASTLAAIAVATQAGAGSLGGGLMAGEMISRGYTRSAEEQADRLGMQYAAQAGYHPTGLTQFLKVLNGIHEEIPTQEMLILRTHPYLVERIRTARAMESEHLPLAGDTPILDPPRFHRAMRRYLYKPEERGVLDRLDQLIVSYRNRDLEGMTSMFHEKFRAGDDSDTPSDPNFKDQLRTRFQKAEKITYDYRLMKLTVGDTDATVVYQYQSKIFEQGSSKPRIHEGVQEAVWRKSRGVWKLMRLR